MINPKLEEKGLLLIMDEFYINKKAIIKQTYSLLIDRIN